MELLVHADEALTVSRVAGTLRQSRATTTAVLDELAGAGWVSRTGDGYLVGPGFTGLSVTRPTVPDAVREELRGLADRVECGVTLSRVGAGSLTIIARQQGGEQALPAIARGQRLPLSFPAGASVLPWRNAAERRTWINGTSPSQRPAAERLLDLVETRGVALFRPSPEDAGLVDVLAHLLHAAGTELLNPRLRDRALHQLARLTAQPYTAAELDGDEVLPLSYLAVPVLDQARTATHELQVGPLRAAASQAERDQYIEHTQRTGTALGTLL